MRNFLTPREVAERLGVTSVTVCSWLRKGLLRGCRVGKKLWRIDPDDLSEFVARGWNVPSQLKVASGHKEAD
ncbi:MAG TPA: helix-turn-helix domain-containing protein [Bacillota bacterium]|nr:helix-turn-helix domain-containing protein [Bacillota bacterium]